MGFFPLFMDLSGKEALMVGGGPSAERKVKTLLEFGASVRLVSPQATPELLRLAAVGALQYQKREYGRGDLESVSLAVAAVRNREVGRAVYRDAAARSVPVNVVDMPEFCTFFFPAVVKRGDFVIGVTTSGSYPAFSRYAREKLEALFPECCGEMLRVLKEDRRKVRREIKDPALRKKVLEELLEMAVRAESESESLTVCRGPGEGAAHAAFRRR